MNFIDNTPLSSFVIIALTLGLAPFTPPHVWEKLQMLVAGTLVRPLDIGDLLMHGLPWVALVVKLTRLSKGRPAE